MITTGVNLIVTAIVRSVSVICVHVFRQNILLRIATAFVGFVVIFYTPVTERTIENTYHMFAQYMLLLYAFTVLVRRSESDV